MGERGSAARRALDPDALAAREEERDFLLRSLDDLERERAAGDVDDADYVRLKDDYTARAAAVIRSIERRQEAMAAATPASSVGRRLAWGALVVAIAVLAGLLIAQASGTRQGDDTATGDPIADTRTLLAEAQRLATAGDYDGSIATYTKALDRQPSNVEALTYRGWSRFRAGDAAGAAADIDDAIAFDPRYPDARVFRASVYFNGGTGDADAAAEQLAVFDTLDAPALLHQILAAQGLRERVALARVGPVFLVAVPPALAGSGFGADEVFLAAQQLDKETRAADELKLLDLLVRADPTDKRAVTYRAWVLARVGVSQSSPTALDAALGDFDRVLRADPTYAPALVFRAFTLQFGRGQAAAAKADLDAFDALAAKPADLVSLIDQHKLRAAITEALAK